MRRSLSITVVLATSSCGRLGFDAATSDAVGSADDSTVTGGDAASRCSTLTDVLLCDGFEDTLARWTPHSINNGTVTLDASRWFRGGQSLHAHTNATTTNGQVRAMIVEKSILPTAPAQLFVRAFVFAPAPRPMDKIAWAVMNQSVSPFYGLVFHYADSTGEALMYNSTSGTELNTTSTSVFPFGTWACVEWQVSFTAPQQFAVWLDDAPVADLTVQQTTQPSPPVDAIQLGLYLTHAIVPHAAYDLWLDEVIIDDQRIGCAK